MNTQKPNIIFIISDQLRHDMLGCYGHPSVITPNLDRLAQNSTVFDNCYAPNPICLPSRTSMITGKYVHQHGCHENSQVMDRNEVCFPALLRDNGYWTSIVGKLHLWEQWVKPCHADHGFQVRGSMLEGKHSLSTRVEESRIYFDYLYDMGLNIPHQYHIDPVCREKLWARISEYPTEHYVDTFLTTRATHIINDAERFPFMMQLGLCSPHEFYDPPQEYFDMYEGVEIPEAIYDPQAVAGKSPAFRETQEQHAHEHNLPLREWDDSTRERIRFMRRCYLATITLVDAQIGRVIEALKAKGIYENTAIIFIADHGEYQGDHGCIKKACFTYENNLHVPLMIHAPFLNLKPGRVQGLVQNLDIFATILDLAGIESPVDVPSRSLVPLMKDNSATVRDCAYGQYYDRQMVRKGDLKLVADLSCNFYELYNVNNDPMEQINLSNEPEYKKALEDLKKELTFFEKG